MAPVRNFAFMMGDRYQSQSQKYGHGQGNPGQDDRPYPYAVELGAHETDKLLLLQKNYERAPQNYEAAFEYLRELNRQGKYLTVIRLYKNAEIRF